MPPPNLTEDSLMHISYKILLPAKYGEVIDAESFRHMRSLVKQYRAEGQRVLWQVGLLFTRVAK